MDKQYNMFDKIVKVNESPDSKIPNDIKLKPNQLWCPYCSQIVVFVRDKYKGVKRCPYCKISDSDYNVKKVNRTWTKRR